MSANILIRLMLLEEEEDEEMLLLCMEEERLRASILPFYKKRSSESFFKKLVQQVNETEFRELFRVNFAQFRFILNLTRDALKTPSYNRVQYPITPEEKLAITLRYVALGESFRSLAHAFRISTSYISIILQNTLPVLADKLRPVCISPLTRDDQKRKAQEFYQKWDFPNCVGAIDGKHIRIRYKDPLSTVLLATVDANYKFTCIDVGPYGQEGEVGILEKSNIGKAIKSGEMPFPEPSALPSSDTILPYVFVGDSSFRLSVHVMKPYSKRAATAVAPKAKFNDHIDRAREVAHETFALLSQVFRIFYHPINLKAERVDNVIIVACCLHNLLRDAYLEADGEPYYRFDPSNSPPYKTIVPLAKSGGFANANGFTVRDSFMEYFSQMVTSSESVD